METSIGYRLAHPKPGDAVVISGLAGRYPDADNTKMFAEALYNKVDLVSDDTRRWFPFHNEIPQRTGKMNDINKLDYGFFDIRQREALYMDPMLRVTLEKAVEAVIDAGVNPAELEGTNTDVFVGICSSETEKSFFYENTFTNAGGVLGCMRSLQALRISHFLKLNGYSYSLDTACSSSIHAINVAYESIREGHCNQAIVAGVNICLSPYFSLQFSRLGMLSPEGICRVFDNNANGYVRSEAMSAIFLQKERDARRIYGKVLHSKLNCDGYKPDGITYPASEAQVTLFKEFYKECGVSPSTISFVEAHGTGTKVGDPEEVLAIDEVFCKNRDDALLIGSTKSNIGHTEPASFLCSLTKVIYALENNCIPPNINFKTPRMDVEALQTGRIKVVTEKYKWKNHNGLIAINNFGFGGANGHVLVQQHNKIKRNRKPKDNLPRLVCVSGRTINAVATIIDDIKNRPIDCEFLRLFHEIFSKPMPNEQYRGFTIVSKDSEKTRSINSYFKKRQLAFIFNVLDANLTDIIKSLWSIQIFKTTLNRIHTILNELKSYNIFDIIMNYVPTNIAHNLLLNITIHIGIVDIMKNLEIIPDFYAGNFIGELTCCYYEDMLAIKEIIKIILKICEGYKECDYKQKSQFTIVEELTKLIPFKLVDSVKWKHSTNNVTNSELTMLLLNSLLYCKEKDMSTMFSSHTILVHCGTIPASNSSQLSNAIHLLENEEDPVYSLLVTLGRLYQFGYNAKLYRLYPEIKWPVSRQTPMISPLLKWNYSKDLYVIEMQGVRENKFDRCVINTKYNDWSYITGHVVNGRNLFPAAGYLYLVMDTFTKLRWTKINKTNMCIENVKFIKATNMPMNQHLIFDVTIEHNGDFIITDKDGVVVSGRIFELQNPQDEVINFDLKDECNSLLPLAAKDIYKELRLRGYSYSGHFRGIAECNNLASAGKLKWEDNWTTFIDSMLQLQILQEDTRNLYVPTFIQQIIICPDLHFIDINNNCIDVKVQKSAKTIRAGGVQIRGIGCAAISKRKPLSDPVIESYQFVPNETILSLTESIRVNVQIILENNPQNEFKSFEIFENIRDGCEPLSPIVQNVVKDQPLIHSDIKLFSNTPIESTGVTICDKPVEYETNLLLVMGCNLLNNVDNLTKILTALEPNGFILTRENNNLVDISDVVELTVFTKHIIPQSNEILFLLKKTDSKQQYPQSYFQIPNNLSDLSWISTLKEQLQLNSNVIIVSKGEHCNGVLGFVNCLRREPGRLNTRCCFIMDEIIFDINDKIYQDQLKKGMHINVFKNSIWGTYRHLLINEATYRKAEQCFAIVTSPGDLSSLTWVEGPLTTNSSLEKDHVLVHVYYSSLNFRDILTASGRLPFDIGVKTRVFRQGYQGMEFAGRDESGKRVIGMSSRGALSTLHMADKYMLWDIPEDWSMEDAVTVPVVYATVLYAFKAAGGLREGKKVLIHSGAGGIGQAALNIALYYKCVVFTTVGTEEKREFLLKHFPQLSPNHIGNSRDTSFEDMIRKYTDGEGVDIVLNSLAEARLFASLRCIARGGHMLEIGKFDLVNDNELGLYAFEKKINIRGIMLDLVFEMDIRKMVQEMVLEALKKGIIKPLHRTVFPRDKIEDAFRYMATGKHTGKVIINIRPEERKLVIPKHQLFKCRSKFYCDPHSSYIVVGGLGGFGMELADWLVIKGCKKLVFVSRHGLTTGYQDLRIRFWKKYVDTIVISKVDITLKEDCVKLMAQANKLGPVDAIFNLAVVLKDDFFSSLTIQDFKESLGPKAIATKNLDETSRKHCPNLRYFVVFSSVSCGRGNASQTNYGMSNSVMERICEKRREDGYPALAIQWGAIGDVGLVADMSEMNRDVVIGGTLQQRISSCIDLMDSFLCHEATIISSMVVAEKRAGCNVEEVICNILGIKDMKTINLQMTLPELGMDSITGVEIKQIIERDFDISLTPQEMKKMTFVRLRELSDKKDIINEQPNIQMQPTDWLSTVLQNMKDTHLRYVPFISLPTLSTQKQNLPTVHLLPGIEGMCSVLNPLTMMLECKAIGYQFLSTSRNHNMQYLAEDIFKHFPKEDMEFNLVAYSYGCMVGLELVDILERHGKIGNLIFIDGSPTYFKNMFHRIFNIDNEEYLKTALLLELISSNVPSDISLGIKAKVLKCSTFASQLNAVLESVSNHEHFSREYIEKSYYAVYNRLHGLKNYTPTNSKLKSKLKLFRPMNSEVEVDYGLSRYFQNPVEVKIVNADHVTILHNQEVINEINSSIWNYT